MFYLNMSEQMSTRTKQVFDVYARFQMVFVGQGWGNRSDFVSVFPVFSPSLPSRSVDVQAIARPVFLCHIVTFLTGFDCTEPVLLPLCAASAYRTSQVIQTGAVVDNQRI